MANASEKYRENVIRMGIPAGNCIGVATSVVRSFAKKVGKSQELAFELWDTKYHEARMLGCSADGSEDNNRSGSREADS